MAALEHLSNLGWAGVAGVALWLLKVEKAEKTAQRAELVALIDRKDAALTAANAWLQQAFEELQRRRNGSPQG